MPRRGRGGRFEKGGGRSRRRASRRSYGGRRRSKPVHSVTTEGGALVSVYGLTFAKPSASGTSTVDFIKAGDLNSAGYQLKESIPFVGKDPNQAALRSTVGTGVALIIGGKVAGWLMPSLRRPLRIGRLKIRLLG